MAFLCPSRHGRNRQKKGHMIDRPRGYYSLENLTKLDTNNNQDTRHILLQNFKSFSPDELTVKQGQKVNIVYRDGDWAYVITDDKKKGLVPYAYCARLGNASISKQTLNENSPTTSIPTIVRDSLDSDRKVSSDSNGNTADDIHVFRHSVEESILSVSDWSNDSAIESQQDPDDWNPLAELERDMLCSVSPPPAPAERTPKFLEIFQPQSTKGTNDSKHYNDSAVESKHNCNRSVEKTQDVPRYSSPSATIDTHTNTYRVLYDYISIDPDDICVQADDIVVVNDTENPFWFWVQKSDGVLGFIPSNYLTKVDSKHAGQSQKRNGAGSFHACGTIVKRSSRNSYTRAFASLTDLSIETSESDRSAVRHKPQKPPRKKKKPRVSTHSNKNAESLNIKLEDSNGNYIRESHPTDAHINAVNVANKNLINLNHCQQSNGDLDLKNPLTVNNRENTWLENHLKMKHSQISSPPNDNKDMEKSDSSRPPIPTNRLSSRTRERQPRSGHSKRLQHTEDPVQDSRKRSSSTPPFRSSYAYEQARNDYYEETFYEEPKLRSKSSEPHDAINVSNILKIRKDQERIGTGMCSKVASGKECPRHKGSNGLYTQFDNLHKIPNMKQYLATLPSTEIGNANESVAAYKTKQTKSQVNVEPEITRKDSKRNVSSKKSLKHDWSFGYPRKAKDSVKKSHRENDVSSEKQHINQEDQAFLDLLDQTNTLLDHSDQLLASKNKSLSSKNKNKTTMSNNEIADKTYNYRKETNTSKQIEMQQRNNISADGDENDINYDMYSKVKHSRESFKNESDSEYTVETESELNDETETEFYDETETEYSDVATNDTLSEISLPMYASVIKRNKDPHNDPVASQLSKQQSDSESIPNETGPERAIEFNNPAEKCSYYLSSQVINKKCSERIADNADTKPNNIKQLDNIATIKESTNDETTTCSATLVAQSNQQHCDKLVANEKRFYNDVRGITEFVCQYDYVPESPDALPLYQGEILHIGLDIQEDDEWYYAYSPRFRKYGYVPRNYVQIPVVTII